MYKQVKENWTKNKTKQNRGAYQSPLSWTSKPRILHLCKFPFTCLYIKSLSSSTSMIYLGKLMGFPHEDE